LLDALERPPTHADARIDDVLTGEVLAVVDVERRGFVCTAEGCARVSREVFRGAA
jgi:hypothetical protein